MHRGVIDVDDDEVKAKKLSHLVGWGNKTTSLMSLYYSPGATLGGGGAVGPDGPYGRARRRMMARRPKRRNTGHRRQGVTAGRVVFAPSDRLVQHTKTDQVRSEPAHQGSKALDEGILRPLIDVAFWSPFKEVRRDAAEAFASLCAHRTCSRVLGLVGSDVPAYHGCVRAADELGGSAPMAMALGALLQLIVVTDPNNDVSIICKASTALASLVRVESVAQRLVESPEGIQHTLHLLRLSNLTANRNGIHIVSVVADLPEAPGAIVDAGGMRALMPVLNSSDRRVRQGVLATAVKLAASVLLPSRISDSSTLYRTLELFEAAKKPELRVCLLDLIVQLASNPDVRPRLVAAGVLKTLGNLMSTATSVAVLCQVMTCLQRLCLTPEVQPHVIDAPIVGLVLQTLFGSVTGTEDPIPKESRAGRIVVISEAPQHSESPARAATPKALLSSSPGVHGSSAALSTSSSVAPTQFRHILTRHGAKIGGSTTSMGRDLGGAGGGGGKMSGTPKRPSSRASHSSRPRSRQRRPSSRSSRPRSGSPRPHSPRVTSRPSSPRMHTARSRPGSASRPLSRSQLLTLDDELSQPGRPSSRAEHQVAVGDTSGVLVEEADETDENTERRVAFFHNHPELDEASAGEDSDDEANQASKIELRETFQGRLPDKAHTAILLAAVARFKRKANGRAEAIAAGVHVTNAGDTGDDGSVSPSPDAAGRITPPPEGAMLGVYVDHEADRERRRAKRFERLQPPLSKAQSTRVMRGNGTGVLAPRRSATAGVGQLVLQHRKAKPSGTPGAAANRRAGSGPPKVVGVKGNRTYGGKGVSFSVSPVRGVQPRNASTLGPRKPQRRRSQRRVSGANGTVGSPRKVVAAQLKQAGRTAEVAKTHRRAAKDKRAKKGKSKAEGRRKGRGGSVDDGGVSLGHVMSSATRAKKVGELARLINMMVAQERVMGAMPMVPPEHAHNPSLATRKHGLGDTVSRVAEETNARGIASAQTLVHCMRFLQVCCCWWVRRYSLRLSLTPLLHADHDDLRHAATVEAAASGDADVRAAVLVQAVA